MYKNHILVGAAICALIVTSLACGSSNSGVQVGTSVPSAASAVPVQAQVYHMGEVVQINQQTIVLNSAQISGNELQANFTIENKGTEDLNVSSMLSFEAKGNDGTKLEQDIFNCTSGGLDGKILPGDKLKGNICWKGVATDTVKIYYTADVFGSGATVWEVSK